MHPRFRHLKRVTPSLYCRLAVETDGTFWSDVFKYFLFSGWSTKCTCANIDKMLGDNFMLKNIPVTRNVWLVTALLFFIHSKKRRSSSSCLSSGPTTLCFSNCLPLKKKVFTCCTNKSLPQKILILRAQQTISISHGMWLFSKKSGLTSVWLKEEWVTAREILSTT